MLLPALLAAGFVALLIFLNERFGLFGLDRFPNGTAKIVAYGWLASFFVLVTVLVTSSAQQQQPTARDLSRTPFWILFLMHVILIVFLAGWWLLSGRPDLRRFFNFPHSDHGRGFLLGIGVGVGAWVAMVAIVLSVTGVLVALGLFAPDSKPSPMIPWMAALPAWKKAMIVFSAMTVEEAFFRGWMQKRLGLIVSTILFALAHAGYGQPILLLGVTIVSLVIGITFYKTKNLLPCIVAHGVFDAIQLFVMVPIAIKLLPQIAG